MTDLELDKECSALGNMGNVEGQLPQAKPSFPSLFKDNRGCLADVGLKYIEPTNKDFVISFDEIDSVEKSMGFCLVGCIMGPRPKASTIAKFVKGWGKEVKFQLHDHGWIKFTFPTAENRDNILHGGPYLIQGKQLFLKDMPPCFMYDEDDLCMIPSWVQIHGLPPDCWTISVLSKIASILGKPIHTDRLTLTRQFTTYARVLIEIDIKKARIQHYTICLPTGKKITIEFKYEFVPIFCSNCKAIGHASDICKQF